MIAGGALVAPPASANGTSSASSSSDGGTTAAEKKAAEKKAAKKKAAKKLAAKKKAARKSGDLSFSPARVVKVAKRYTGSPYRFGGSSTAGFDCSGFTKYVYGKFGIELPHSAWSQSRLGNRINPSNKKPGDIIVTAGGSHVGIYVGKGKFIDAPMPGQSVHVRDIYTSSYSVVRLKKHAKS